MHYSDICLFQEPLPCGPCNLFTFLEGACRVMVAHGRIHPLSGDTVHHSTLTAGQVRVAIDEVIEGYEVLPLPFPNEELEFLGHAKGGFVKWQSNLVEPCEQVLKNLKYV